MTTDKHAAEYLQVLATTQRGTWARKTAIFNLEPPVTETQFYQRVGALIESEQGLRIDPVTCRRERESRERWAEQRNA